MCYFVLQCSTAIIQWKNTMTESNINWQAEQLRATIFTPSEVESSPEGWWESATGELPERSTNLRRTKEFQEEGSFHNGILTLTVQPFRIDWIFRPNDNTAIDSLPSIGSAFDALTQFKEVIERWLENTQLQAQRLAFGAVFLHQEEDRIRAYEHLDTLLPSIKIDAQNSSEFGYNINRPRQSNLIPDLRINRLSRWEVQTLIRGYLEGSLQGLNARRIDSQIYAVRVELDINTSVEYTGQFEGNLSHQVLDSLMDLGIEILTQGDIP